MYDPGDALYVRAWIGYGDPGRLESGREGKAIFVAPASLGVEWIRKGCNQEKKGWRICLSIVLSLKAQSK